jgi:D-alanyl-D-alanine carboxypeptidase
MRRQPNARSVALLTFVLCLAATGAASVPSRADKVDDYVRAEMQKQSIPGLSLAVVKDGKVVKAEGYGLANVELNVPARPDTVYKIGSVSKQFIATGVVLLAADGRLGLDDRVSKYLDGTPEAWQAITVRHLLTHTSGIVREAPGFHPYKVQSDAEVVKTAYSLPLRFAPGEKWEYCNVGYFALAEIIRQVSGRPWEEFLTERVFKPAGMAATRATTVNEIVPNRAGGYNVENGRLKNAGELLAVRPSGAFLSTVLDLARWDAALYTDQILKGPARDEMWTPVKLNSGAAHPYGLGWELGEANGHRIVRHGGTLAGFRAEMLRLVDDRLTVIVLTNCGNARPEAIARGVAAFYVNGLAAATGR